MLKEKQIMGLKNIGLIKRKAYRMAPCPIYDIEGMESWLESMAENGYFLNADGFWAGVGAFSINPPVQARYRLRAAPENAKKQDEVNKGADEAGDVSGWDYVADCGGFQIYVSYDPEAGELSADTQVQAFDTLRKRQRDRLWFSKIWLIVFPLAWFIARGLLGVIGLGSLFCLGGTLLAFCAFYGSFRKAMHIRRLSSRLSSGEALDRNKRLGKRAVYYPAKRIIFIVLILVWIALSVNGWTNGVNEESLTDYEGETPFALIGDLRPDGAYSANTFYNFSNNVIKKSDLLSPTIINVSQIGSVDLGDGSKLEGGLEIDYYVTAAPWVARQLAREQQAKDRRSEKYYYLPLEIHALDVEYAVAYSAVFPTLIMVDGNRMIRILFYQTSSSYNMPFDEWAIVFAEHFKN